MRNGISKIDSNFAHLISYNSLSVGYFSFKTVTESYIRKLLTKLDDSTSPGSSGITVKVIKYSNSLVASFTIIINQCL